MADPLPTGIGSVPVGLAARGPARRRPRAPAGPPTRPAPDARPAARPAPEPAVARIGSPPSGGGPGRPRTLVQTGGDSGVRMSAAVMESSGLGPVRGWNSRSGLGLLVAT